MQIDTKFSRPQVFSEIQRTGDFDGSAKFNAGRNRYKRNLKTKIKENKWQK
ncbi:hypothetical protein HMPREF1139_0405 [Campylobacter sp. FOBRC14]|nr:hypothetical protein HMPREF1139_0405 [Campylobacter sp. FOBRC14]